MKPSRSELSTPDAAPRRSASYVRAHTYPAPMISQAAVDAVTSPDNLSPLKDSNTGIWAVRDQDVVAELRRLEGLGEGEARRLGREAVAHVGGHVEHIAGAGLRVGRLQRRHREVWWVPRTSVRG